MSSPTAAYPDVPKAPGCQPGAFGYVSLPARWMRHCSRAYKGSAAVGARPSTTFAWVSTEVDLKHTGRMGA